jgi:hypothetical protein
MKRLVIAQVSVGIANDSTRIGAAIRSATLAFNVLDRRKHACKS